jgi:mRNA interferase MazF
MNSADRPKRGEVWLAAFGTARPGEPGKTRPAVVITPTELIGDSPRDLVVVVPLSSSVSASALRPKIAKRSGLSDDSLAVPLAIRGVARRRLEERIGKVGRAELRAIEVALGYSLGLVEV